MHQDEKPQVDDAVDEAPDNGLIKAEDGCVGSEAARSDVRT